MTPLTDYSKSPNRLGDQLYTELFKSDHAVMPRLEKLVLGDTSYDENSALLDYIGELWGVVGESVPRSLKTMTCLAPTSLPHKNDWRYLLRIAQCAALVEYGLRVDLKTCQPSEDPHVVATEMIYGLGREVIDLVHRTELDLAQDPVRPAVEWSTTTTEKVAALCIKPHDFRRIYAALVDFSQPEQLPLALQGDTPPNIQRSSIALYRIGTAAVTVGHSVQIDLVRTEPFALTTA